MAAVREWLRDREKSRLVAACRLRVCHEVANCSLFEHTLSISAGAERLSGIVESGEHNERTHKEQKQAVPGKEIIEIRECLFLVRSSVRGVPRLMSIPLFKNKWGFQNLPKFPGASWSSVSEVPARPRSTDSHVRPNRTGCGPRRANTSCCCLQRPTPPAPLFSLQSPLCLPLPAGANHSSPLSRLRACVAWAY